VSILARLRRPVIGAPLGGGPSTPELAAAVTAAGGLGFIAAGYRTVDETAVQLAAARGQTDGPLGLNLFVPGAPVVDRDSVDVYARRLAAWAAQRDLPLGAPRHDDDHWAGKLALAEAHAPDVVSFTFGCPEASIVRRLRHAGSEVWVVVTSPEEARTAVAAGADALVVQGAEAGGHQASFDDALDEEPRGLLELLARVRAAVDVPLIGAGGIGDRHAFADAQAAGAAAGQIGTALLLAPEAGTSAVHRDALVAATAPTALTRAWSGRLARGIVNGFQAEHTVAAPRGYPEIHYLTAPLRAHGRDVGDRDLVNLWAGEAYPLARAAPAGEIVAAMCGER